VALQHDPLGVAERGRLAQDLLRIASLPRSCRLPARRVSSISSAGRPSRVAIRRQLGDPCEWLPCRRRACRPRGRGSPRREARGAVASDREPLEIRELHHVGPGDADAVLAVFLRQYSAFVGEGRINSSRSPRGRGNVATPALTVSSSTSVRSAATRSGPRSSVRRERRRSSRASQEDRELVAAEPEGSPPWRSRPATCEQPAADVASAVIVERRRDERRAGSGCACAHSTRS